MYGVGIGIGIAVLLIFYHLISASLSIESEFVDPTGFEINNEVRSWELSPFGLALSVLAGMIIPFLIFLVGAYGSYWWEARVSGLRLSFFQLIKMHLRGVSRKHVVKLLIRAYHAGLELEAESVVNEVLAEVDVDRVVSVMISGDNANVETKFKDMCKHFLSGVDLEKVMEAMKTAVSSGYEHSLNYNELANHSLSKVDVQKLVDAYLSAKNGDIEISLNKLKEHDLANGDITKTVDALIAALNANITRITFEDIAAIDLAGLDVKQAVRSAIVPRVFETTGVMGHARDGVQLTMKVKVTVRSVLKRLLGGAGEDTIIARINESLVSEIGQSHSHTDILVSAFELADRVERKKDFLGEGTAYEILSIDVSDIEVGRDINASLKIEQARSDAAQARTDLIRAEEKVKKAMAAAFIEGTLTPKEYFEMLNTQADTGMRKSMSDRPHEDPRRKK
jgi:uncharacterized protein YqfA (UPF0365 family)